MLKETHFMISNVRTYLLSMFVNLKKKTKNQQMQMFYSSGQSPSNNDDIIKFFFIAVVVVSKIHKYYPFHNVSLPDALKTFIFSAIPNKY